MPATTDRNPDLDGLLAFLAAPTPQAWLDAVPDALPTLLVDHAHCEKKAAAAALGLIHRHPERALLVARMSRLAREELRHFEQVLSRLERRGIEFREIGPPRYAASLHAACRGEPALKLVDQLIVGALIEARSCERFNAMVPVLQDMGEGELARFYGGLLASEARHYTHYLELAREAAGAAGDEVEARISSLRALEAELIGTPEDCFRFHSGPPVPPSG